MGRKSVGKKGLAKTEDVNLIPVMSILVILIPMLIFMFKYDEISVQEVSLPKTGGPSTSQGPKKLNLSILVSEDGFRIKVQGESESGVVPGDQIIPKKLLTSCVSTDPVMSYDYPELYNRMIKLQANRDLGLEDTVNIGAKDSIPWRVLARTIDAVRNVKEADSYPNLCDFTKAKSRKMEKKDAEGKVTKIPVELFPKVVFIVL